ncbi:MAG: RNA polymerase sigma-70 factor (ECF subfamily) [Planctomycetota bacterium]
MPDSQTGPAAGDVPAGYSLTGRIASGDESAFAEFYEAWFASTLALSRAISRRDEAWCLDVVQDVMMTVANKMPSLLTNEALRAWMTRTVMNAVTDRSRREARRRRREELAAEVARGAVAEPWIELCDRERLSWLSASVADLTDTDRALLQARFGEAATVAQAAGSLGLTSDAAHGRLRRALEILRQKAAEYWHGT